MNDPILQALVDLKKEASDVRSAVLQQALDEIAKLLLSCVVTDEKQ